MKQDWENHAVVRVTSAAWLNGASNSKTKGNQMTINKLLALDVRKLVEKKNGLSYLSWAHAWAEALIADPASTFHVDTFQRADGTTIPYMEMNGGTGMVWVRVTMFGKEMTCFLPIMDHRNKPIPNPDSFQINTAIMRCMTKALALHGLGLHIYAGEDLPMGQDEEEKPKEETKAEERVEKVKEAVAVFLSSSDRANAELFADGMVEFVLICKTEAGLKSYWKANQTKIDDLKSNHPDLFTRVRDVFSEMKAKFKENASE